MDEYSAVGRLGLGGHACSATLLTPSQALTDAHCFDGWALVEGSRSTVDGLDVGFVSFSTRGGYVARVVSAAIHPYYRSRVAENLSPDSSDYDVAVVELGPWFHPDARDFEDHRRVPLSEPVGVHYPTLVRSTAGRRCDLEAVGWGLAGRDDAAVLQQALGGRPRALPVCVALGGDNLIAAPLARPVEWGGGNICRGDSGGPVAAGDPRGEFRVYGVLRSATSLLGHCRGGTLSLADSFRIESFDNPVIQSFLEPLVGPIGTE